MADVDNESNLATPSDLGLEAAQRLSRQQTEPKEQKQITGDVHAKGFNFQEALTGSNPVVPPEMSGSSAQSRDGRNLGSSNNRSVNAAPANKLEPRDTETVPRTTPINPEQGNVRGQPAATEGSRPFVPVQTMNRDAGYQPAAQPSPRDVSTTTRVGDSQVVKAPDVQSGTTRTIGPISLATTPDGKTIVSKDSGQLNSQPASQDRVAVAPRPQEGSQKPLAVSDYQPRPTTPETPVITNPVRSANGERVDNSVNAVRASTPPNAESGNIIRPTPAAPEIQSQQRSVSNPELQNRIASALPTDAASNRELGGLRNQSGSVADNSGRQIPSAPEKSFPSGEVRASDAAAARAFDATTPKASTQQPSADVQGRNPASTPVDSQMKVPGAGALDSSIRPGAPSSLDSSAKLNPPGSLDLQGKTINSPTDSQGKQIGSNTDAFGTRRESGVQLPDTRQTSGRADSGVQLPDTKQSSGRTDTGGTQGSDSRVNSGRNDANNAKIPDAKTLANLDQKFGDKLNPPGKDSGLPIPMPSGGLPDILGGLRGDKDGKGVRDAKPEVAGSREGAVKNDGPKDTKSVDGKIDTKSGIDDKLGPGQKGPRSESDVAAKNPDGKSAQDVRNTNPDGRTNVDGKASDGRPQGGSNLVHDGGSKGDAAQTNRVDATNKSGDKGVPDRITADGKISDKGIPDRGNADGRIADKGTPDKASADGRISDKGTPDKASADGRISDKGNSDKGVADRGIADKGISDPRTRIDQPAGRVDTDGKFVGSKPDSGAKGEIADKGRGDTNSGVRTPGVKSDAPFVLPPGSLPVPDLVGGVKNLGQNIDIRIGKQQPIDDKSPRLPDASKLDGQKSSTITGGASKDNNSLADGSKANSSKADASTHSFMGDGVKTVVTGGLRAGDKSAAQPDGKLNDGVKTVVTGGVPTADGVKTSVTGSSKGAESAKSGEVSNSAGKKLDVPPIVTPGVVPLTEMVGNLKGIAARIFPPESRTGRPDAFDNSLPGRKTERLADRNAAPAAGVRVESAIPIIRALGARPEVKSADPTSERAAERITLRPGEATGKPNEQFVIKMPQPSDRTSGVPQSRHEQVAPVPPWVAPKDNVVHDEAAEKLLVNFELVGSIESAGAVESVGAIESIGAVESEEEEVFPLAAVEYFGSDFEKAISTEEEVAFDGDGTVAPDDEQSTRYQYIVEAGDTVELISIKVFQNVSLAPLIYEINKDSIPIGMQEGRLVFLLTVGMIIWLPFPKEVKAFLERPGGLGST